MAKRPATLVSALHFRNGVVRLLFVEVICNGTRMLRCLGLIKESLPVIDVDLTTWTDLVTSDAWVWNC